MEENKNKNQQHHASKSNPDKSFEAGKKGGTPSMETSNQSSNVVNSPNSSGSSTSSGDTHSRVDKQNRPTQGEGWQSDRNSADQSGKKTQ